MNSQTLNGCVKAVMMFYNCTVARTIDCIRVGIRSLEQHSKLNSRCSMVRKQIDDEIMEKGKVQEVVCSEHPKQEEDMYESSQPVKCEVLKLHKTM